MSFRLPELSYPLTVDTIGKVLAMGSEIHVFCHTDGCGRNSRVNLVRLSHRLGMDHGCMEADLKRVLYCQACQEAGRPSRNIGFITVSPGPRSEWPREK